MFSGIRLGEYVEGICSIVLPLLSANVSVPHFPVTIKATTSFSHSWLKSWVMWYIPLKEWRKSSQLKNNLRYLFGRHRLQVHSNKSCSQQNVISNKFPPVPISTDRFTTYWSGMKVLPNKVQLICLHLHYCLDCINVCWLYEINFSISGCTDHFEEDEERALETTRNIVATLNWDEFATPSGAKYLSHHWNICHTVTLL